MDQNSIADRVLAHLGETEEQARARFRAQDPDYQNELDEYAAKRKPMMPFTPGDVAAKLRQLMDMLRAPRGPQPGTEMLNGGPVHQPGMLQMPAPAVGGVRG